MIEVNDQSLPPSHRESVNDSNTGSNGYIGILDESRAVRVKKMNNAVFTIQEEENETAGAISSLGTRSRASLPHLKEKQKMKNSQVGFNTARLPFVSNGGQTERVERRIADKGLGFAKTGNFKGGNFN